MTDENEKPTSISFELFDIDGRPVTRGNVKTTEKLIEKIKNNLGEKAAQAFQLLHESGIYINGTMQFIHTGRIAIKAHFKKEDLNGAPNE